VLRFLDLGDHRLEYAWHGPLPVEAPTLVFLHEGLGSVSAWKDFPARLAEATGCGALVYSRRGYGGSDRAPWPRPVAFMHDEARVALPRVLALAGVREAILVGHSDGASIALIYAGSRGGETGPGANLRALALEAPHVFVEDVTVASIAAARAAYRHGELRRSLARHHATDVDATFEGWSEVWLDPAFRAWNIEEVLPSVRVPVLVVQGEDDPYGTVRQVAAIAAACPGPVETRLLPRRGHAPHREAPAEALAAMSRFVSGANEKMKPRDR